MSKSAATHAGTIKAWLVLVWMRRVAVLACLISPCLLQAQDLPSGRPSCETLTFPDDQGDYGLARVVDRVVDERVVDEGRLYFLSDRDGCPSDDESCHAGAYVVNGDTVITGRSFGAYRCVLYPGARGIRVGWVQQERLRAIALAAPSSLTAWIGHWSYFDDTLTLTQRDASLVARGEAYWPNANPPQDQFPVGPNIGDMAGTAQPRAGQVTFIDGSGPYSCKLQARLLGTLLLVGDNANCGGNKVRFNGVYQKQ